MTSMLFAPGEPARIYQLRQQTEGHRKMAGVTSPSFHCAKCGQRKLTAGRKMVTPGVFADGYLCADCAPAPEAAPPVALKRPARAKALPKPPKPSSGRKTLMTDEQVLECRAAYEFEGVKPLTLQRRYGVSSDYMRALLSYIVRSKLIPKRQQ